MKRILTIALRAATVLALAVLGSAVLSSCKPEKKDPVQLTAPQPKLSAATVNTLSFTWPQVANAAQYTYELLSPDGSKTDGGTTAETKTEFKGLKDNTAYTFKVVAYPASGSEDYLASVAGQCIGTTVAVTPLAKPVLNVEVGDESVTVSWNAVANAASYDYAYAAEGGSAVTGNTAETSLTIKLDMGKYTFTLQALSSDAAYSASEKASAEFEVKRLADWKVQGTFEDGGGRIWIDEMVAWSDGSYTIKNWYGIEGYDFEFVLNENGTIGILNSTSDNPDYPEVESGEGSISLYTGIYNGYSYSGFEGDKEQGSLWFSSYTTNGDCVFTWPVRTVTMDEVVGTYAQDNSYYFYDYDYSDWILYKSENDVTITKIDDKTVSIEGFMYPADYGGKPLTATLDSEKGALIIQPQQLTEWYTLAGDTDKAGVIAKWNGGTLTFSSWCLWYNGYYYAYGYYTALTKK